VHRLSGESQIFWRAQVLGYAFAEQPKAAVPTISCLLTKPTCKIPTSGNSGQKWGTPAGYV